ncbi:MAG: TIGR03546 family protein [Pseudobdellovibrio sp.]
MTLLLKQLVNFIQLLHSENGTKQVALGLTLGVFLGFSPFFSLQTFLVLLILLIFRIQIGSAFISAFAFKFIAFLIDPVADSLGQWALENESFRPLWTQLYNMPIIPYTLFNNSIVMGSFLFALILSPILYFTFIVLIEKYRTRIVAKFESSKMWKGVKATKLYFLYKKYRDLGY